MNDRINDLRCPKCGALAFDIDNDMALCAEGHSWNVDPSETYTPALLDALEEAETRLCALELKAAHLRGMAFGIKSSETPRLGVRDLADAILADLPVPDCDDKEVKP